jgi:hypothetical protein
MLPMTLRVLIAMIAAAINDRLQRKLDYVEEERRVLQEQIDALTGGLRHLVIFGERHLRYVLKEFMAHYHRERFHQGLGGQLVEAQAGSTSDKGARGKVVCRSRLGGMLNFCYRQAA